MPQFPTHGGPLPSTCERYGEHQGDYYEQTDIDGQAWECWTCCDEKHLAENPWPDVFHAGLVSKEDVVPYSEGR